MSRLNGDFMDSNNIVIINDVPYFSYKGNSYLEKLKNGLSLDVVFFMEDSAINSQHKIEDKIEENVEVLVEATPPLVEATPPLVKATPPLVKEKQYQPFNYELFDEDYDCVVDPMPRKGKKTIKIRCDKNMKKNKVRQNGYDDKMHTIESNLPSVCDEDTDLCIDYDVFDDYDYWDDNLDEDDFDYYERYSFDSLDIYYAGNRTGRGWD
jgi:hypothetical protein